ncbi:MAG: GTP-binding protein HflX [Gammaproteobacteria bacterium]
MFEFERPQGGERAILVHIKFPFQSDQDDLDEFIELVRSAGLLDSDVLTGSRQQPHARTFMGKGKLEELSALVKQHEVDVVLFNHSLSPSQERNLEAVLQCRVLDRTGLILDIFAQRAHSYEGKLQVELAQLKHLSTRLVRGWTHLERQKGGIGLRGPGETQLETDRRLLSKRIKYLNSRLVRVSKQREQGRQARKKAEIPTVSLVGYTNAGKSTLFNTLTEAGAYAADKLFATLDPTLRKIEIGNGVPIILVDTVGFIRHLPHDLVAAFRATLVETREADLILHVVDCADESRNEKIAAVNQVLTDIDASEIPQLVVFNKTDLLQFSPRIDEDEDGNIWRVWLSAQENLGMDLLFKGLQARFDSENTCCQLTLNPSEGEIRAFLHEYNVIRQEQFESNGDITLQIEMSPRLQQRLHHQFKLSDDRLVIATDSLAGAA